MGMNLKQLEAFVKVAEEKSFSKAAKILFLTQPTISAHISALEKELNTRLFMRTTKEVSLSGDGELLYQYARQITALEEKIRDTFLRNEKKDIRCISIAASSIPGQYLLPEILARYSEKFPDKQFYVTETDSARVVEQVAGHMADVGFTGTILENRQCIYIPFYCDKLAIIMPDTPKYRKIQQNETTLDWIADEPIIMREEGSGTRKEAEKQLRKAGVDVERLHIVAQIENPDSIKKYVRQGIGITVISRLAVRDDLASGMVLEFPLPNTGKRSLYLVHHQDRPLPSSVEQLIQTAKRLYH